MPIHIHHQRPDVVVIVAFAVVSALDAQRPPIPADDAHLQVRQQRVLRVRCRLTCASRMEQTLQKARKVRHVADAVRRLTAQVLPHRRQRRIAKQFARALQSLAIHHRARVAVREVREIAIPQRHQQREAQHVPQLRLVPAVKPGFRHQFKAVQQAARRHVPVRRTLVAAAVRRDAAQIRIEHPAGAAVHRQRIVQQAPRREHHVRHNPRRPVAQILACEPHPPVGIAVQERVNRAALNFRRHPLAQGAVKAIAQQRQRKGQHHGGLRSEQVQYRLAADRKRVRRRQVRMGADRPCRFLADAPQAILHRGQIRRFSVQAHV